MCVFDKRVSLYVYVFCHRTADSEVNISHAWTVNYIQYVYKLYSEFACTQHSYENVHLKKKEEFIWLMQIQYVWITFVNNERPLQWFTTLVLGTPSVYWFLFQAELQSQNCNKLLISVCRSWWGPPLSWTDRAFSFHVVIKFVVTVRNDDLFTFWQMCTASESLSSSSSSSSSSFSSVYLTAVGKLNYVHYRHLLKVLRFCISLYIYTLK